MRNLKICENYDETSENGDFMELLINWLNSKNCE